ncbi:MAG: isochorismatase family protein [Gammaproteobacteria bacterium]|nr:isochorismatase family protein [Gammaproteobacteria bacterium]
MNEWEAQTRDAYERKGLGARVGWGEKPGLVVVDFAKGFTDPTTPLGSDVSAELAATASLLDAFRRFDFPVVFMTVAYRPDYADAGTFIQKVPALSILVEGSPMVEIDERIAPLPSEQVVTKKFASAFFGTDVAETLRANDVDTVVLAGCSTSGCVRASAIDAMQNGFRTIVVEQAVADRAEGPHRANLFDMDSKYADVVSLDSALESLTALGAAPAPSAATASR